jgi:BirA family biotin operon repressor/biotin-[acetyl-CoA-carboxylase] ligase
MARSVFSANLIPLLKLMTDGRFHSGEDMARHFSVSRATVFNLLNEAENFGLQIHAVRGKGYRLATSVNWLDVSRLKTEISRQGLGYTLMHQDIVESTNSWLVHEAQAGAMHQTIAYAEFQYGGKGRRGRRWESSLGGGIAFSVLWRFDRGISQLSGLSIVVGLALARAIGSRSATPVKLKWPNDLLAGYRKLAGILVEVQGEMSGPSFAVIGIGLNQRLHEMQRQEIDQAVVDLAQIGVEASREELMLDILKEMSGLMKTFEQEGIQPMIDEWITWHAHQDKEVVLRMADGSTYVGIARGLDKSGNLRLVGKSGEERIVAAGEVSMRAGDRA